MAKLTDDEKRMLEELQRKAEAPDDDGRGGHDLSIIVDLSDEQAVRRALKLGVLTRGDLDEFEDAKPPAGEGETAGEGEEEPKPKGDRAPRRKLSIADRAMGAQTE